MFCNKVILSVVAICDRVSKVIKRLCLFCLTALCDWLAKLITFLTNQKQAKPTAAWLHAFSRAWQRSRVFASSSDWFMALFVSIVTRHRIDLVLVLHSIENRSNTAGSHNKTAQKQTRFHPISQRNYLQIMKLKRTK